MKLIGLDDICKKTVLPICFPYWIINNPSNSMSKFIPECYARPIELANTMIFQFGNASVHFLTMIILLIIIYNVRARYIAIARTEMLFFFSVFFLLIISTLIVDCVMIPHSSFFYPYCVAVQIGLSSATCISLLYNGLLFFQFWEDGTYISRCALSLISLGWCLANISVFISAFNNWKIFYNVPASKLFFIFSYFCNSVILITYVVLQLILVFFALDSYWPLGPIFLGSFFFIIGQLVTYFFNNSVCTITSHYIDGLFLGSIGNVLAIMMIYKYWLMITTDDLEFSITNLLRSKHNTKLVD